eukprot:6199711-Pleurochrysis_carterae.AAC.3
MRESGEHALTGMCVHVHIQTDTLVHASAHIWAHVCARARTKHAEAQAQHARTLLRALTIIHPYTRHLTGA